MNDNNKIIYSINIEDVQNVAKQELHRLLTDKELKLVEDKIGDYMNWYDVVAILIGNIIKDEKL